MSPVRLALSTRVTRSRVDKHSAALGRRAMDGTLTGAEEGVLLP